MRTTNDMLQLLSSVPLFEGLSKRELRSILQACKEVSYPDGHVIVEEGATGGVGFHVIAEGKAKVVIRGRARATLGPGDSFGEISLVDRGPRTATVVADGAVRGLAMTSWAFMPLLDRHPSITKKLLIGLCKMYRQANEEPVPL